MWAFLRLMEILPIFLPTPRNDSDRDATALYETTLALFRFARCWYPWGKLMQWDKRRP
jgi:hypothetical protein